MKHCFHVITAVQIHRWPGMLKTFGLSQHWTNCERKKNGKKVLKKNFKSKIQWGAMYYPLVSTVKIKLVEESKTYWLVPFQYA